MNGQPQNTGPTIRSPRPSLFITIIAAWLALAPRPAVAQEQAKKSEPAEAKSQPPAPIPTSQLSVRAEEAAAQLRELRDRPVQDAKIDQIEAQLPDVLRRTNELTKATDASLVESVSARTLEDLERRWERTKKLIDGWRDRVVRRGQAIDRDMATLLKMRRVWEATLEDAKANQSQDAVQSIIKTALEQIRQEEARFGEHRARLISIGLKIGQAENMIDDASRQIEAAQKELRMRLRVFDTPPLWESLLHPPPRGDMEKQLRMVARNSYFSLREFVTYYRNWLFVHTLVFVLLCLLMRSLRNRVKHLNLEHPELEESTGIVSRPYSAALLLSLVGVLLVYPYPPRLVEELTTVLCFIPLYRILPRKVFNQLGRLLIWLVCLHIVDRVNDILPYLSLLKRILLLLLNAVTLAVVVRTIKDDATGHIGGTRHLRAIERVAAFLLSTALVSNILGNLSLAAMLVTAVIASAYSALVLYAIYLIVDAVLKIGVDTRAARSLRMVRRHGDMIVRRISSVLQFGFKLVWLGAALHWLQVLPFVTEAARHILNADARFGNISVSLGGLVAFLVTVWAAFIISRIVRFILGEDVFPRMSLPRGIPNALSTGFHYIILLVAFILAVAATGVDLGKFAILAGAFGVGIGFGLQNVVNNFISGLILIIERPVMPGDTIEFGDRIGDVKQIGIRASTIRTWSGAEVIVPNGNLISSEVINWTLSDRQRRLDVPVGVAYGSPVKKVMEVLANVAIGHPDILDNPAPRVLFRSFGDSSLDFELRCWT
ncbi:MAG: mechanosensitive ion channel, partial [Candidatus Latescibacterota bacterium]